MKGSLLIFIFALAAAYNAGAQTVLEKIIGKWRVEKYSPSLNPKDPYGVFEFKQDGTFVSEGMFFGSQEGMYRTDENRNVLIIETNSGITEWLIYLKGDTLRLMATTEGDFGELFFVLSKVKENG